MNFRVIEGTQGFWDDFPEFVKLYNEGKMRIIEIRKKLELSQSKYRQYRDRGFEQKLLNKELRTPRNSCIRGGVRNGINIKNYYHDRKTGFEVKKRINGKDYYFGNYPTEQQAKKAVELLRECNWDKSKLPSIKKQVAQMELK